jgi:hypothetical protein
MLAFTVPTTRQVALLALEHKSSVLAYLIKLVRLPLSADALGAANGVYRFDW